MAYVDKGVSAPVSPLMRYDASRPDAVPAAKTNWPVGSRPKALGTASVATCPRAVNCPVAASTANPARLLWPRLPTYRNCPDAVRWIWEQVFRAVNPSGRVVSV